RRRTPAVVGPDGNFSSVGGLRGSARRLRFRAPHRGGALGRTRGFCVHDNQSNVRRHRTASAALSHHRVLRAGHFVVAGRVRLSPGISFAGVINMKSLSFVLVAATVLVVSVSAQTSLSLWPYYIEVSPQNPAAGMYDLVVPLPVMDKARADLADLRLFDSANREVPYAIRIRKDVDEEEEIQADLFNSGDAGPSTGEVSVDLREHY